VFHFIPAEPPLLKDLGLPSSTAKLINHKNGIVLITGPSGSGKTSTMAALINLLNEERSDHVLSIEDPIEYLHESKRCIVNQREVNRHTRSFANALRSALREDPDVLCIGELRDLETISLALSAAETGHLVLGTLHTQGAIRTINRVIGAYPPGQQAQVRTMLSESLRAVVSQKLIPRADGSGMALAFELLLVNVACANLIRENRTFQISSVLQTGKAHGMRSMDDSLLELVQKNVINKKEAVLHADDPRLFK
jgi:twitching motility protein PilT